MTNINVVYIPKTNEFKTIYVFVLLIYSIRYKFCNINISSTMFNNTQWFVFVLHQVPVNHVCRWSTWRKLMRPVLPRNTHQNMSQPWKQLELFLKWCVLQISNVFVVNQNQTLLLSTLGLVLTLSKHSTTTVSALWYRFHLLDCHIGLLYNFHTIERFIFSR